MQSFLFITFTLIVALVSSVDANIEELDEVWKRRAQEAKKAAKDAYHPHPARVTNEFNRHVHRSLERYDARRSLGKHDLSKKKPEACEATNPIDQCWRCDPNWAHDRKKLAHCALGFGHGTTGGKEGEIYVVTNPADDDLLNPKPGTLRHAVIQERPLWIIFARDMVIRLCEELIMTSNKTIDARGANVNLHNSAQITMQYVRNIIIHGLHIRESKEGNGGMIRDSVHHFGQRSKSDGDGISMYGASNIWLDHLSMSNCQDGLIDAVAGSTAITISNCHFTNHNDVMLFGASDSNPQDSVMQITVAFNHFGKGLVQRMPRCRWGFVHVLNNDYTHWLMYAIGGSSHPTIISQGNRFIAPPDAACKEVTKRDYASESEWKTWTWRSENDLMMNGAFFVQSGNPILNFHNKDMIPAKHGEFVAALTRHSGSLDCVVGKPC